jgi:hypothetical protein
MEGKEINRQVLVLFLNAGYQLVSRRTAGTAFGSEEFDDGKTWTCCRARRSGYGTHSGVCGMRFGRGERNGNQGYRYKNARERNYFYSFHDPGSFIVGRSPCKFLTKFGKITGFPSFRMPEPSPSYAKTLNSEKFTPVLALK